MGQDSCPAPSCPGCPRSKPQALSIPLSLLSLLIIKPGLSSAVSCSVFMASTSCLLPHWPPPPSPPSCSVFWCSSHVLACAAQPQPVPSTCLLPPLFLGRQPLILTCTCTHTVMLFNLLKSDYSHERKANAGFRAGHFIFAHATQLPTASTSLFSPRQPQFMSIYSPPAPFTPRHCVPGASLIGATWHPQPQATCPCPACSPAPPCHAKEGEGRGSPAHVPQLGWEVIMGHDQRGHKPGYARKGGEMKKHYVLFTFI